ncbi:MAG TPA: hypothetical protein VMZ29_07055 [Candidatus Bathyarchaeia archaeon]|nr:hypothetical protein [Candidatus Bathyarchaeia archaeon]
MHQDDVGLSKATSSINSKCAICDKLISENDLVYISDDPSRNFITHFRCYVEIQEKICSECGMPFRDQEILLFCDEHREYFHSSEKCLKDHFEKHLKFKQGIYDATKNRIVLLDLDESLTDY